MPDFLFDTDINQFLKYVRRNDLVEIDKIIIIALWNRDKPEFRHVLDNHDIFCDASYWAHEMMKDECWNVRNMNIWEYYNGGIEPRYNRWMRAYPYTPFLTDDKNRIMFIASLIWSFYYRHPNLASDANMHAAQMDLISSDGMWSLSSCANDPSQLSSDSGLITQSLLEEKSGGALRTTWWMNAVYKPEPSILHGYECDIRTGYEYEIYRLSEQVKRS